MSRPKPSVVVLAVLASLPCVASVCQKVCCTDGEGNYWVAGSAESCES